MTESQNIQIPMTLFKDLVGFFNLVSLSKINFSKLYKFEDIHEHLRKKQDSINLHTAYTKMARARNDEQRLAARKDYMTLRSKKVVERG